MQITYAIADIGTNSVRLMLADATRTPVKKYLTTTRIGEALHQTGLLSSAGMERTLEALKGYKALADEHAVPMWTFATSAVRDAKNKAEFLAMAEAAGIIIDVVDGETEGMLGYLGVGAPGRMALIDIGGGSSEIACGENGQLLTSFSAPVGCVRALDRFRGDTSQAALSELKDWLKNAQVTEKGLRRTMTEAAKALGKVDSVYAVSGTATSLASLFVGATDSYQPEKIQGIAVEKQTIEELTAKLAATPVAELCAIPVLGKRGDLIAYGGALLLACMELLGAERIVISDSDNLEGYLRYRLDRNGANG